MNRAQLIEPDLEFIRELKTRGGEAVKKCYQCASCSVVCALSSADHPFPRKEMVWAQWGLKERLLQDPDIWLCYQCHDCSRYCPRGANPGDVLASLRQVAIIQNAFPRWLARMMGDPQYLLILITIPVIILGLLIWSLGSLQIPPGPIVYRKFISYEIVDAVFLLTALWVVICSSIGIRRLYSGFQMTRPLADVSILSVNGLKKHLLPTLLEILQHTSFKDCVVNRARYFAHLNILWGFILLAFTTASVATGIYLFGKQTPWPLYHPVKVIGNIGGLILITGALIALWRRLAYGSDSEKTTYSDWLFLLTVLLTGISGLLTEVFRLVNIPRLAYSTYFIHLVLVWILFVSLPFSKFAHLLYRTTAMIYTRIQRMQESL